MKIKRQEVSAALLGIAVALILWLTILGREAQIRGFLFYKPFHSLSLLWRDIQRGGLRGNFLGNLILFVPIGALLPTMTGWRNLWKIATTGFAFSLIIETIQLITYRGCFDPDDVLLNTIGTVIGFGMFRFWVRYWE